MRAGTATPRRVARPPRARRATILNPRPCVAAACRGKLAGDFPFGVAMNDAQLDVGEVTRLLRSAREGDPAAVERLVPLVYEDLRRIARRQLGYEQGDRTLNATALVHESYLKLRAGALAATDRAHFLAIAARAMRQVLVDYARERKAVKRGG